MDVLTELRSAPAAKLSTAVTLSVVVPVFNEQAVLVAFHRRLSAVLLEAGFSYEVIYVDDGSTDRTQRILKSLQLSQPMTALVRLSRNFGKEAAMTAGLRLARGDAVIIIDADLQDPPELIPDMLQAWLSGNDVVNLRRRSREGESFWKRVTAGAFYRFIERISEIPITREVGDFRLFSRRAVEALNQMPERGRFMKGMFAWIGFPQTTIEYDREARAAGEAKQGFLKLVGLALDGITAFSAVPLRMATWLGIAAAGSAFVYAIYFLLKVLVRGDPVQGFPTLIISMLFLGGLQLLCMGVLGEYVARIFTETKRTAHVPDRKLPSRGASFTGRSSVISLAGSWNRARASLGSLTLALLALLLVLRFVLLAVFPLGHSEGRYAEIARKMVEFGDWVILSLVRSGRAVLGRTPLGTWLSAAGIELLGVSPFAVRIPHLLIALAVIWLTVGWARRSGIRQWPYIVPLLASSSLFLFASGAVMTDMALCLGATLATRGFWLSVNGPDVGRRTKGGSSSSAWPSCCWPRDRSDGC